MQRKSVRMVRANKHKVIINGVAYLVTDVQHLDTGMIQLTLDGYVIGDGMIRRSPGTKIDVEVA